MKNYSNFLNEHIQESPSIKDFKIGDRVIGVNKYYCPEDIIGATGKVIGHYLDKYVTIEFDNIVKLGHSADRIGKSDFCYYLLPEQLKLIGRNSKKRIKKKMPDIDPYDEEDWGYIQEKLDKKIFKIGDKVKLSQYFIDKYKVPNSIESFAFRKASSFGTIINILGQFSYPILVDWDNKERETYAETELEYYDDKRTKIKRPDIDPYDEEDWGYVQESINPESRFKEMSAILFNNKSEHDSLMIELEKDGYVWADGKQTPPTQKNHFFDYNNRVIYLKKNGIISCSRLSFYEENDEFKNKYTLIKYNIDKKYKKITHPDIDPFDEEDWGYVQENLDEKLNSLTLMGVYRKFDGGREKVLNYLKKELCGNLVEFTYYGEEILIGKKVVSVVDDIEFPSHFIFVCDGKNYTKVDLEKEIIYFPSGKKYKKITHPDIDPFDEEDWGYVQENLLLENINFNKQSKKKNAKTDTYNVVKSGTTIGQVKWSSRMRGYAFLPTKECDVDIKEFVKNLMAKRRLLKK